MKKWWLDRQKAYREIHDTSFRGVDTSLSNLGTGIEAGALKDDIEWKNKMLETIGDLLQKYQSLESWIKSAEWSGATKRQLRHRLNENIQDLKRMERDLSKHNYTNLTHYKSRLWELIYYYQHYEQVRQITTLWWRTSDIHSIIDSKQDAKRARRYEQSDTKYQQSMNAILHDTALTSLWNDDMERYEEYLEAVVNWQVEPSSHPFYKSHAQSFKLISCTNPDLYKIIAPSWRRIQYSAIPTSASAVWAWVYTWARTIGQRESFVTKAWKSLWELMSNFPSIEQDPRKKQAWEQLGSLVALSWAVFMWIKVIQNVFSSKETNPNKRWKAAWWWAGLLALTNSDRIIDRAQNITWWHPSERIQTATELFQSYWFKEPEAQRIAEMHIWAPIATLSALHFIPIYELTAKNIVGYNDDQFTFNFDNYQKYVETMELDQEQKDIILAAWQRLRDENSINAWLGCFHANNPAYLSRMAWGDQNRTLADAPEVQSWRKDCIENIRCGVNAELASQWLIPQNSEAMLKIMNEYNHNWWTKIKKEDMTTLIIKWMNEWLLDVNDPNKNYEISDMLNDNNINLQKKTIKWFTNTWGTEIEFKSYKELFNIVNLTNWIQKNFRWRPTVNKENKPFHIDVWWFIEFDDTKCWELWKNETKVIKALTLSDISSTLEGNKQFYVDYLNKRRQNWGFLNL